MKSTCLLFLAICPFAVLAADPTPPASPSSQSTPSTAAAAPPPAAPAKRSAADLEKLVAPIALYPDPLLATLLPASVYPLEIVQAARFVANTNNLAKIDQQPWDANVKAVARVPEVIKKMNDELSWTMELGEAFLAQDKDIMDAIQSMRGKAQKAGTLQTTPQQIVTVTNIIIEKTVEQQVVTVPNTVVQIQPANPEIVYVPSYNPYTVYYPPPAYVYNPFAPLVTFGAGMAMGAIIANNCDWWGGGCYNNNVNINVDRDFNNNIDRNNINRDNPRSPGGGRGGQTKWQPDQSRLSKSGAPGPANTARNAEARGWGSGGPGQSGGGAGAPPSTGAVGARPSTGAAGTRPSTGAAGGRPTTGTAAARPTTGTAATRPSSGTAANRPTASPGMNRPSASPQPRPSAPVSRPAPAQSRSAFSGASAGAGARNNSSRGAASRGAASRGGGGRSAGGGGGRR